MIHLHLTAQSHNQHVIKYSKEKKNNKEKKKGIGEGRIIGEGVRDISINYI